MSNPIAIAAVTATLRNLLYAGVNTDVPGTGVTTRPPDRARANVQGNQVNLFLYQTKLDAAWRNQEMFGSVQAGEAGQPPLPLSLHYIITAYADNDDEVVGHRLLGRAMSVLHDHPVLEAAEIKAAIAESDLDQQVERVRITPQPLTLEEMSKLWTTFQTQYRISAAYEASVVLIESSRPVRSPVPVISRGTDDGGAIAQADTLPPIPTILAIGLPRGQTAALVGDAVTLSGHHLDVITSVRISNTRSAVSVVVPPPPLVSVAWDSVALTLADMPGKLIAGMCSVCGVIGDGGADDTFTNEVALAVAPRVTNATAVRTAVGTVDITIRCVPQVLPGQDVRLLLMDRQIALDQLAAPTDTLVFGGLDISAGDYLLRLRIDGVDSLLVDKSGPRPAFDPTQTVAVP